jgi:hypothetical protein
VHLGLYGDLRSVRRLLRSREAGAWAKAVASREVILHPTPPYVAVALGADAVRRVAQKSSAVFGGGLLGGLDPLRQMMPVLGLLRTRVAEVASVTQTLGFDPLKLLASFLQRVDPDEAGDGDGDVEAGGTREDEGRYGDADAESVAYDLAAHGASANGLADEEDVPLSRASIPYAHLDADESFDDSLGADDEDDGRLENDETEEGEDEADGPSTGERLGSRRDEDDEAP